MSVQKAKIFVVCLNSLTPNTCDSRVDVQKRRGLNIIGDPSPFLDYHFLLCSKKVYNSISLVRWRGWFRFTFSNKVALNLSLALPLPLPLISPLLIPSFFFKMAKNTKAQLLIYVGMKIDKIWSKSMNSFLKSYIISTNW